MDKVWASAAEAVHDITDGAALAVGGFGLCGIPGNLIKALLAQGIQDLETVSNNCGIDGEGLGLLLNAGRIRRTTGSYVGENREFARQYLGGELELELTPQGTLAERLRAGGCGYTRLLHPGRGRHSRRCGRPALEIRQRRLVAVASPAKEVRRFDGTDFVLETFDRLRLRTGPRDYRRPAREPRLRRISPQFQPALRDGRRVTIAEVEQLVEPGELAPDRIHTPGVFVHRVVEVGAADKKIEKLTVTPRPGDGV